MKISSYIAAPMIAAGTLFSPGAQAFNLGTKPRVPGPQPHTLRQAPQNHRLHTLSMHKAPFISDGFSIGQSDVIHTRNTHTAPFSKLFAHSQEMKLNMPQTHSSSDSYDFFQELDAADSLHNDFQLSGGANDHSNAHSSKLSINGGAVIGALSVAAHTMGAIDHTLMQHLHCPQTLHQAVSLAQHVHHGFANLQHHGLVQHFDHFMEELVRHSSVEVEASKGDDGKPGAPEVRLNLKWSQNSPAFTMNMKLDQTPMQSIAQGVGAGAATKGFQQHLKHDYHQLSMDVGVGTVTAQITKDDHHLVALKFTEKSSGIEMELPKAQAFNPLKLLN